MRVFILCTGRSGSVAITHACSHITNFSSAHESLSRVLGSKRFDYPENHIEADNRLSWHLGELEKHFGDQAIYVHLRRDSEKTALSFLNRLNTETSIIKSYIQGIKLLPLRELNQEQRHQACLDYVETVNSNIEGFLSTKSKTLTIQLENIKEDFKTFWEMVGAEGNLENALKEFDVKHNPSKKADISSLIYKMKTFLSKVTAAFR